MARHENLLWEDLELVLIWKIPPEGMATSSTLIWRIPRPESLADYGHRNEVEHDWATNTCFHSFSIEVSNGYLRSSYFVYITVIPFYGEVIEDLSFFI